MLKFKGIVFALASISASTTVLGQEMRCGNELIAGDQIHPLIKAQVIEKCGEPTEKGFDRWFYQEQGKILVFNGNDELDHIEDANEE